MLISNQEIKLLISVLMIEDYRRFFKQKKSVFFHYRLYQCIRWFRLYQKKNYIKQVFFDETFFI